MMNSIRGRPLFTVTQQQELEQQANIFRCLASGIPIPNELLFPLRRSSMDSSRIYSNPPMNWGYAFQMGFGKKIDPEPGRCRRTDGKKWRCSKEAHQESKYCERHMHRGKSRSRKPVEQVTAPATLAPSPPTFLSKNTNAPAPNMFTSFTEPPPMHQHQTQPYSFQNQPLGYQSSVPASRPAGFNCK